MSLERLPFKIGDTHGGFSDTEGLARLDGDVLVLELRTKFLGLVDAGLRTVEIDLADIAEAEVENKVLRRKLVLHVRSMKVLEGIPGAKAGRLELGIAKRDVPSAEAMATVISFYLAEHKLSELDERLGWLEEEEGY